MTASLEIAVAGETLEARGDHTLFWPSARTLFVADLHLGKGAAFRAGGVPIPAGTTLATLAALGRAVQASGATRLIVLGDLWHARAGRTEENKAALAAWRADRPHVETLLILGNHDIGAGWELDAAPPGLHLLPFVLRHHPEPDPAGYVLCGHVHPGVRIDGLGGQSMRLPCFHFTPQVGTLPAFGELTGTAQIHPRTDDRTFVVAEGKVALAPTRDRSRGFRR